MLPNDVVFFGSSQFCFSPVESLLALPRRRVVASSTGQLIIRIIIFF